MGIHSPLIPKPVFQKPILRHHHDKRCHGPTLHPILSSSGLQWRTHNPPASSIFTFLLGLRPQEKPQLCWVKAFHIWLFNIHFPGNVGHYSPPLLGPSVLAGTLRPEIKLWYHSITAPLSARYCRVQGCSGSHTTHQPAPVLLLYWAYTLKKRPRVCWVKAFHIWLLTIHSPGDVGHYIRLLNNQVKHHKSTS